LAAHDDLTELPNRWMFGEAVNDTVKAGHRYGHTFAVMFMDLDRFKNINDTLGHAAGDVLLIETAKRLNECLRESDVIARIGGDEFVIMLREVSDQSQVSTVARKVLSAVVKPLAIYGHECRITGSIGISMFPTDALFQTPAARWPDYSTLPSAEKFPIDVLKKSLLLSGLNTLGHDGEIKHSAERQRAPAR
jgi:diguanylate cyclase (GGDEF)-like protein